MKGVKITYLAIIASLTVHVIVLGSMYWASVSREKDTLFEGGPPLDMDFVELAPLEPAEGGPEEQLMAVTANDDGERVSERMSNWSKERIADDVYKDLKQLEEEFRKEAEADNVKAKYEGDIPDDPELHDYSNVGATTEGAVSATFSLTNRYPMDDPLPTYKCRSAGTVRINVSVDKDGNVTAKDINPSQTTTSNDCLLQEALNYVSKWKFDPSVNHPKKQQGWVEFRFQSQ